MDYCHSNGVSHRDLKVFFIIYYKPENLLLDDKDNLKISDFGLSSLTNPNETKEKLLQTTCGTYHF